MDLRHFRYFVAVAEELHFGRAARRLGVAQPALSQQVQRLEREIGVRLLERTSRRVELTPAGRAFLDEARGVVARAEKATQVARQTAAGETGELVVACGPIASSLVVAGILARYRGAVPGVRIRLREALMGAAVSSLQDGTADVGLMVPYFHSEILDRATLVTAPLAAALPVSHPLAGARRIPLARLARERFILFPLSEGSGFHERVLGICQRAGFTPVVSDAASHVRTLLMLVAAGYGISLVPDAGPGVPGVACVPLREAFANVDVAVAWRGRPSELVQSFIDTALSYGRQLTRRSRK